jgi:outer membrane receptor protein involved in Fe transport
MSVAGNPFQPDVQFRGFVASPVAGTPQGLAVYQNGVRINEAFGDTVNWDLIPTAAIRSVTVVTNNPAFGLNALGGAVNVQMKNGFNYHGAEINTMGGSFGRIQSSAQWGKQVDNFCRVWRARRTARRRLRNFSASDVRRFYGDVGYKNDAANFMSTWASPQQFRRGATVPVELLQQYWGATYTTPQTTANRVGYVNLTGRSRPRRPGRSKARRMCGFSTRRRWTAIRPAPSHAPPIRRCFASATTGTPANGLNGAQLANPFDPNARCWERIDRTTTRSTTTGVSLQATNSDQLFGHNNQFVVGGSFDSSVTRFTASAELGTIGPNFVVSGSGIFLGQSGDPGFDRPGRASHHQPVQRALRARHVRRHQCVLDHGGGRFNTARISSRTRSAAALNGNDTFNRFNPIIGGTYKITPELTAYAGYSEANRAPTPLELGCADPAHPCIIAAFLVSDPPLKQVVSRTVEAGLRGTKELNIGTLGWKLGAFRAENTDDILAIPSPVLQGFGYFQNVGSTRRQGIEAEVNLSSPVCKNISVPA